MVTAVEFIQDRMTDKDVLDAKLSTITTTIDQRLTSMDERIVSCDELRKQDRAALSADIKSAHTDLESKVMAAFTDNLNTVK